MIVVAAGPLIAGPEQPAAADVEIVYRTISSRPMAERRAIYRALSPAVRAALWKRQLDTFLSEHPDAPAEQRELVGLALTLLTARTFELQRGTPEWDGEVGAPMQRLTEAVRRVFPRHTAAALFAQLGPADPARELASGSGRWRGVTHSVDYCDCTRADDWCWFSDCVGSICYKDEGCGTWWQYECTSRCGS
ncbi:MAG TPA: bacteriocin fulvocin C-related protein [Thermoanaerobaculia bacterium]